MVIKGGGGHPTPVSSHGRLWVTRAPFPNILPRVLTVNIGGRFIGRKLVEALKRGGQRVRVLDRKECKPTERVEGVEYMVGDLCDLASRSCYW